ncbi:NUDIX hydrolase [Haliscomenobacter hydrossis]|uniref:NUDIX hydrolase n=1 Tax=Haliscomenobacter hydrossis (strain ATCC 27775 / DSM 1100 / LMG 10767 / O) TaxID=760192 RepID=F4L5S4_HALH1|nr:NUDIX domain-containing protein [Haliscomenobacter hydrossis]AEE52034.1 NUDIX hydrolase [Haliscomenobacter hydrossis DSM 1100]
MDELIAVLTEIKALFNRSLSELSIDCVVFGFHDNQLKVLLLRVKGSDAWSLPGGWIYKTEDVEHAAYRILQERTGLDSIFLQQFHAFGANQRYNGKEVMAKMGLPPEHNFFPERAVSIGYYALVEYSLVEPKTDLFTDECRWWDVAEIPDLLFDHNDIASIALKTLRRQFDYQPIGFNLLPEKFTLIELQKLHETVLGHPLDRGNFQKKMLSYGFLERLEERKTGGAHKAPYLYRFDAKKYEIYLRDNE